MTAPWTPEQSRRDFLKLTAAAGAAGTGLLSLPAGAQGAPLNYYTWSAAVDLVKSHLTAFEAKTGIKVNYSNAPWAQYRDTMVTKFVGKAPIDALWVSDSWLPEWADAGWIAPDRRLPRADEVQRGDRRLLHQVDAVQGQAVRPDLLLRLHGLLLRRGDAEEGRHQGAAADLGRGGAAVRHDQEGRPFGVPADAVDGARELADRVPDGPRVFQRRPLHRRQRRGGDGRSQARRAAGAAVGDRRGQQAQDRLARLRGDRRAERPQVLRLGQPRVRHARPLSHPHAQRSEAVADRRARQAVPDARRPGRLARHRRLDALPRDDHRRPRRTRPAPPTPPS